MISDERILFGTDTETVVLPEEIYDRCINQYAKEKKIKEIKTPNKHECIYCNKINSDVEIDISESSTSDFVKEMLRNHPIIRDSKVTRVYTENGRLAMEGINWNISWRLESILRKKMWFHSICKFKSNHYGMNYEEWKLWNREYKKARKLAVKRDNNTCQTCFGKVNKSRIKENQNLLNNEKLRLKMIKQYNLIERIRKKNKADRSVGEQFFSKERLKEVIEYDKKIRLNVHHIKEVRNGGMNDLNNLITICSYCHSNLGINTEGISNSLYRKIKSRYKKILKSKKLKF
ncbi:MAG: hypothetical protein CMO16_05280 [Thaumarchaeota archaeon]|nr:hypothetical protein [Nitrososphaerota archaeon]|tara:strand:+ start:293 stop:1159 length:867 start_codon:yes stop_codon:yes gene_type:complete